MAAVSTAFCMSWYCAKTKDRKPNEARTGRFIASINQPEMPKQYMSNISVPESSP